MPIDIFRHIDLVISGNSELSAELSDVLLYCTFINVYKRLQMFVNIKWNKTSDNSALPELNLYVCKYQLAL